MEREVIDNIRHTEYIWLMVRVQVYIPDELHGEMMLLARRGGTNFSELVRMGVREVIKKKKMARGKRGLWRHFAGALKYGPKDLSTRVNDIYR